MPKPIYSRKPKPRRNPLRLAAGCVGSLFTLVLLGLMATGLAATAAYAALSQSLPPLPSLEQLRQTPPLYQPAQIYGLGEDTDGDGRRDWLLIYELRDPLDGANGWQSIEELPEAVRQAAVGGDCGLGNADCGLAAMTAALTDQLLADRDATLLTTHYSLLTIQHYLLTQRLTQTYSEAELVEWYVNTAYYGQLAYGIEAAAQLYFGKPARQLSLPEAAVLVAIPLAPEQNPIQNPTAAKARQEAVLDALLAQGVYSREAIVAAKFTPLVWATSAEQSRYDLIAPHYALYVRQQLLAQFGAEPLLREGWRVYTPLDLRLQSQAECVARAHVDRLGGGLGLPADEASRCPALAELPQPSGQAVGGNVNEAAVVALDPRTGELKALVGSLNFWENPLSMATDGLRQPGTLLTPFTYLTALAQGYTAASMVLDVETDFGTDYNGIPYVPQNPDGLFHGPMSLRQALGSGYHVPAVEVLGWVGVENALRTARQMGLATLTADSGRIGLPIALGGEQVRLLDVAVAYGVLANNGRLASQPPIALSRIESRTGELIWTAETPLEEQILSPQLAYLMNDMLADNRARCAGVGCPNSLELPDGRPAAVKVGQSNDGRDVWTVGYTPQLVVGVWLGNRENQPLPELRGEVGAAPIWRAIMAWAMAEEAIGRWERPPGLTERTVCIPSGLLSNGLCPTADELFLAGTEPELYDTMVQAVLVNRQTGRLATSYTPPGLVEQRVFVVYPERARPWAEAQNIPTPPTEYDTLGVLRPEGEDAAITSPAPLAAVRGVVEITGWARGADFAHYRLAYFAGLTPTAIEVLTDTVTSRVSAEGVLGVWDTTGLNGLYTLLLTVVREDGTFAEVNVPITIDHVVPEVAWGEEAEGWLPLIATDDIGVVEVAVYVDELPVPYAVLVGEPWGVAVPPVGVGCTRLRAVAVDGAGNESVAAVWARGCE